MRDKCYRFETGTGQDVCAACGQSADAHAALYTVSARYTGGPVTDEMREAVKKLGTEGGPISSAGDAPSAVDEQDMVEIERPAQANTKSLDGQTRVRGFATLHLLKEVRELRAQLAAAVPLANHQAVVRLYQKREAEARADFLACAQAIGVSYEAEGQGSAPGPVDEVVKHITEARHAAEDVAEWQGRAERAESSLSACRALTGGDAKALLDQVEKLRAVARRVVEAHQIETLTEQVAEGGLWVDKPTGEYICGGCGGYFDSATPADEEHETPCVRLEALAALGGVA